MGGFLEKNISTLAGVIERTVASERWSRREGLLQSLDARVKIVVLVLVILLASFIRNIPALLFLYAISVMLAALSGIKPAAFLRRVWIFIPLFTGIVAIPALFLIPGTVLFKWGPLSITREGLTTAAFLILRVSTCVSFTLLLVLTTPWNVIMKALRSIRFPEVAVSLLSVSYRYLLLLLRTLSELLTARRSRVLGTLSFKLELGFVARSAGFLFLKSLHLANGVQMAMISRGRYLMDSSGEDAIHRTSENPSDATAAKHGEGCKPEHEIGIGSIDRKGLPETAFTLKNTRFIYPDGTPGVEIEKLDIPAGACTIILGPNGSGKSTLLKILDGLLFPREGELKVLGETANEDRLGERRFHRWFRSSIGLVFQNADIQCFSPTVREELEFGPAQKGLTKEEIDKRVEKVMKTLRITPLAERYPYRLSSGEKKRVALASVLTLDPDIYVMDEPTAGLDPSTEGILIDLLSNLTSNEKTLVVATQDLLLARHIGEWAVVLSPERRLVSMGPIDEILEDRELLERTGLIHAHLVPHRKTASSFTHTHYTEDDR